MQIFIEHRMAKCHGITMVEVMVAVVLVHGPIGATGSIHYAMKS